VGTASVKRAAMNWKLPALAGFRAMPRLDAGCVSTFALQSTFDLDWIGRLLRWDEYRQAMIRDERVVIRIVPERASGQTY